MGGHKEKADATKQEDSPHQKPTLTASGCQTSSLQKSEAINFCYATESVVFSFGSVSNLLQVYTVTYSRLKQTLLCFNICICSCNPLPCQGREHLQQPRKFPMHHPRKSNLYLPLGGDHCSDSDHHRLSFAYSKMKSYNLYSFFLV